MNSSLTRPKFDLAVDASQLVLTTEQRESLWRALRLVLTGKLAPDPHKPRPCWSDDAIDLREPLRREIEACRKRAAESGIYGRTDSREIPLPNGKTQRASIIFNAYRDALALIQQRMDDVLRDGGHWRSGPVDGVSTAPDPQPIAVLVANEKTAGRAAGTRDWVQWEDPKTRDRLTQFFELAYARQYGGRRWRPYQVPLSSLSERGVAADARRATAWRTAFHKLLTATIASLQEEHDRVTMRDPDDARYEPALAFWEELRDEPQYQTALTEAGDAQARAHRTPSNHRFAHPNSIWHALPIPMRLDLAARFDAIDRGFSEFLLARGLSPVAPAHNPFALTEDELRERSAG